LSLRRVLLGVVVILAVVGAGGLLGRWATNALAAKRDMELMNLLAAEDTDGSGPLHWAAHLGRTGVARRLLELGANPNERNGSDETPLHKAAVKGRLEIAQLLLAKGAEANARDALGWTPLCVAAGAGQKAMVQLLLEKGADASAQDNRGFAPLQAALANDHQDCADLLRARAR
jgi:ankyrin repeat protein